MTQLFPNVQSVPTRETILGQLVEKNLLQHSSPTCQRLFALIESDFTPLSLCLDAKPFLDELEGDEVCDGKLLQYVTPLKQIIFFRLMKQLSEVYANMTIEMFERAASIVPFSIAEKWMASAAKAQGINVQIDYLRKAIVFGAPRKVDMKSMRQPLIDIGHKLQQAILRVAPDDQFKSERLEKQQLSLETNISARIENEHRTIERRKEESEKRKEIQEKEAQEKVRRQELKDAEAERNRKEEERRRRESEKEEQRRREAAMAKNKELLEQMKKQAEQTNAKVKVGGKRITEIVADDLEKIGVDQIEKAREEQVQRERAEKIRQRKLESKRVDHLARAFREEEAKKLDQWAFSIEARDKDFLNEVEARKEEEMRAQHTKDLEEKASLMTYQSAKDRWMEEQMVEREADFREKKAQQEEKLIAMIVENKIKRAKLRKQ